MSHFYSHAPCGARQSLCQRARRPSSFLLTRPLRGATGSSCRDRIHAIGFLLTRPLRGATVFTAYNLLGLNISTHTPLAGRDISEMTRQELAKISTHTPLAGRDVLFKSVGMSFNNFYSHAPCGARHFCPESYWAIFKFLLTRPLRGATCWRAR